VKLVDGFVHVDSLDDRTAIAKLRNEQAAIGIVRWCFAGSNFCRQLGVPDQNPIGLWLKSCFPEEVYVSGSAASFSEDAPRAADPRQPPYGEQVEALSAAGIDGWKLLNGKPDRARIPLNADEYRPLYEALERHRLPLRWHVGDPPEFWDPERIPAWARREWCYTSRHPKLEDLRGQASDVLRAFPNLQVIFNHFFFLGDELERAAEMLERCSNMNLDLTPGIEMYFAFSRNRELARRFFTKYSDRILLGSYCSQSRPPGPVVGMIRRFLESEDSFDPPHGDPFMWPETRGPILGIGLDNRALANIYWNNWRRIVGRRPARLDTKQAAAYLGQWKGMDSGPDLARQVSALIPAGRPTGDRG
jgi:hypothetical protein